MANSDKSTRREFLITTSSAALGAAKPTPATSPDSVDSASHDSPREFYSLDELLKHGPQRTIIGDRVVQVAMPLGGIGAGCVCLNGYGGLQDFSIDHRP